MSETKVGVIIHLYDGFRKVLSDLYDTLVDYAASGGSVNGFDLTFPSGLCIPLDVDFRLPEWDFDLNINFEFPDFSFNIDLPEIKFPIMSIFDVMLKDFSIPGTNSWYFNREGAKQVGTSFTPEEFYKLSDLMLDGGVLALTIFVGYAIKELFGSDVSQKYIMKAIKTTYQAQTMAGKLEDLKDDISSVDTKLDNLSSTIDSSYTLVNTINTNLNAVSAAVNALDSIVDGVDINVVQINSDLVNIQSKLSSILQHLGVRLLMR